MTLIQDQGILIAQRTQGKSHIQSVLRPDKANRHGLITGATGTGKTITLQTLAEGFSALGVPVFMADVKGDLTGLSQPGRLGEKLARVLVERGFDAPDFVAFPTTLWDVFGQQGHPVRATVSDLGPLLLAGQPLRLRPLLQALIASPASRGAVGAAGLQVGLAKRLRRARRIGLR